MRWRFVAWSGVRVRLVPIVYAWQPRATLRAKRLHLLCRSRSLILRPCIKCAAKDMQKTICMQYIRWRRHDANATCPGTARQR